MIGSLNVKLFTLIKYSVTSTQTHVVQLHPINLYLFSLFLMFCSLTVGFSYKGTATVDSLFLDLQHGSQTTQVLCEENAKCKALQIGRLVLTELLPIFSLLSIFLCLHFSNSFIEIFCCDRKECLMNNYNFATNYFK